MQQAVSRRFDQYLFFSDQTVGKDGRRVFINPDLLAPFLEFVREDAFRGKQSLANMIGLKNSAAGLSSQSNQSNASQHRLDCGGVIVTYSVLQAGAPDSFGDGVYITHIQQALNVGEKHLPGLHNIQYRSGSWAPFETTDKKIQHTVATVGADYDPESQKYDLTNTAENMADFLAKNIKGSDLGSEFSLYFCPTDIIDDLGTWRLPEQKVKPGKAGPEDLAEILIETQKQYWTDTDQKHLWYVFEHGAKLLDSALKIVKDRGVTSLSHHEFSFVNPRSNIGLMLTDIEKLRATFSKTLSLNGYGSKYHQATNIEASIAGLQAHDKSWSSLESQLRPCSDILVRAKSLQEGIASDPSKIMNFTNLNFMSLLNKITANLNW
ncbi:hypothetical protein [Microbulbifer sp. ALW1]|uniref:hypothetical protein n=1 Tax=Microbulbifer sp. (strain ALW1) TaxID=1516059 RepID=UPI0013587A7D|nr:hypothetical protein [Microbulbifer sp. ALW1]